MMWDRSVYMALRRHQYVAEARQFTHLCALVKKSYSLASITLLTITLQLLQSRFSHVDPLFRLLRLLPPCQKLLYHHDETDIDSLFLLPQQPGSAYVIENLAWEVSEYRVPCWITCSCAQPGASSSRPTRSTAWPLCPGWPTLSHHRSEDASRSQVQFLERGLGILLRSRT